MAKQGKVLRARKPRDRSRDESLLLRSAESLGRIIGALQRQLDHAARTLSTDSRKTTRKRAKPHADGRKRRAKIKR